MPSGTGNRGNNVPPLAGSEWVLAEGPNRIIRIVLNGLQGPLEVKGDQYGANVMTPFNILTDEQIAAALTFVRHSWGNNAGPVSPEKVKAIREATKDRDGSWSPDELKKIPEKD
jgi:mono/diheme cytochrome c family protein